MMVVQILKIALTNDGSVYKNTFTSEVGLHHDRPCPKGPKQQQQIILIIGDSRTVYLDVIVKQCSDVRTSVAN